MLDLKCEMGLVEVEEVVIMIQTQEIMTIETPIEGHLVSLEGDLMDLVAMDPLEAQVIILHQEDILELTTGTQVFHSLAGQEAQEAQEGHQDIWVQMATQEYYMFLIPMSDQSHLHSSNSLTFQGMHIGGMEILVP